MYAFAERPISVTLTGKEWTALLATAAGQGDLKLYYAVQQQAWRKIASQLDKAATLAVAEQTRG